MSLLGKDIGHGHQECSFDADASNTCAEKSSDNSHLTIYRVRQPSYTVYDVNANNMVNFGKGSIGHFLMVIQFTY
jgi:hypothetical protein